MKLTALLFIIIAPTLAGIGALAPIVTYGTQPIPPLAIPIAAAIGVVVSLPVAFIVGQRISAKRRSGTPPKAGS